MANCGYDIKGVLLADSKNFSSTAKRFGIKARLFSNPINDQYYIWRYIKYLRYSEYYTLKYRKSKNIANLLMLLLSLHILRKMSYKTGFQIPPFTCGKGLTIWHWGSIIINENVRIGENCTLHPGVLIGWKDSEHPGCAKIGDNVFIGSGTKVIGPVTIGNNVILGQNLVITKDIPDDSIVVTKADLRFLK